MSRGDFHHGFTLSIFYCDDCSENEEDKEEEEEETGLTLNSDKGGLIFSPPLSLMSTPSLDCGWFHNGDTFNHSLRHDLFSSAIGDQMLA